MPVAFDTFPSGHGNVDLHKGKTILARSSATVSTVLTKINRSDEKRKRTKLVEKRKILLASVTAETPPGTQYSHIVLHEGVCIVEACTYLGTQTVVKSCLRVHHQFS